MKRWVRREIDSASDDEKQLDLSRMDGREKGNHADANRGAVVVFE